MLIYLDTDVILNYLLQRRNLLEEPLWPEMEDLLVKVFFSDLEVLISTKVLEEAYANLDDPYRVLMMIEMLQARGKLKIVKYSDEELAEANALSPDHRNDALHALLAKKHGCACVVTRNIKDFRLFSDIIETKLPKDV